MFLFKFNYLNKEPVFSGEKNRGSKWGTKKGSRKGDQRGIQKGSKLGSSKGSRLRGPHFVPTHKIQSHAVDAHIIFLNCQKGITISYDFFGVRLSGKLISNYDLH